MNNQRELELFCDRYLPAEYLLLDCRRREIAKEIKTDLSPGLDLFMPRQHLEAIQIPFTYLGGVVGVNAEDGEDVRVCLGDLYGLAAARKIDPDRQNSGYACLSCPLYDLGKVCLKLRHIKMGMGIYQMHCGMGFRSHKKSLLIFIVIGILGQFYS